MAPHPLRTALLAPSTMLLLVLLAALALPAPPARAADAPAPDAQAQSAAKASARAKAKRMAKLSESERLYEQYRDADKLAEASRVCLLDAQCKKPEDDLLEASREASKLLATLEKRARGGDNESAYYLGLIMYDQGRMFAARAKGLRDDPSVGASHEMLMRRARDIYTRAGAFLAQAARAGEPEACMRYGVILADGLGGQIDRALAYKLFRCAALGFIASEKRGKATDAYLRMLELSDPRDIATAEVYAKLRPEEPKSPWRKPPKYAE